MDPRHPQPLTPAAHLVLFQQRIEPSLERPDPRQRLNLALIVERAFRRPDRSEEHTSELQSLMRTSYAGFCLKKQNTNKNTKRDTTTTYEENTTNGTRNNTELR